MKLRFGGYYPPEVEHFAEERMKLRKERKYQEADKIREMVKLKYGVEICDTINGDWTLQWWCER